METPQKKLSLLLQLDTPNPTIPRILRVWVLKGWAQQLHTVGDVCRPNGCFFGNVRGRFRRKKHVFCLFPALRIVFFAKHEHTWFWEPQQKHHCKCHPFHWESSRILKKKERGMYLLWPSTPFPTLSPGHPKRWHVQILLRFTKRLGPPEIGVGNRNQKTSSTSGGSIKPLNSQTL